MTESAGRARLIAKPWFYNLEYAVRALVATHASRRDRPHLLAAVDEAIRRLEAAEALAGQEEAPRMFRCGKCGAEYNQPRTTCVNTAVVDGKLDACGGVVNPSAQVAKAEEDAPREENPMQEVTASGLTREQLHAALGRLDRMPACGRGQHEWGAVVEGIQCRWCRVLVAGINAQAIWNAPAEAEEHAPAPPRPKPTAHSLTLEFGRFLSEAEWRDVVDAARLVPHTQNLHANAVAVTHWQGIETAPHDGTWFLAWDRDCEFTIQRRGLGFIAAEEPDATHWMPLPDPPEVSGSDRPDSERP